MEVRQLDSAWTTCTGGINGVYDPPTALHSQKTLAMPTLPLIHTTTSSEAVPASTLVPPSAPQTSTAYIQTSDPASPSSSTVLQASIDPRPSGSSDIPTSSNSANGIDPQATDGSNVVITYSFTETSADSLPSQTIPDRSPSASYESGVLSASPADPSGVVPPSTESDATAETTNALTILSAADSSAESQLTPATGPTDPASTDPLSSLDPNTSGSPTPQMSDPGASQIAPPAAQLTVVVDPSSPDIVVIGTQTLAPGQQATVDNTIVSLASTGASVFGWRTTDILPAPTEAGATSSGESSALVLTVDGGTQSSAAIGETLLLGSSLVVLPTLDSGLSSGSAVLTVEFGGYGSTGVLGSSNIAPDTMTLAVSGPAPTEVTAVLETQFTIGSQAYTAAAVSSGMIIVSNGGSAATVNGQRLSAMTDGMVVGTGTSSSTIALTPSTEASAEVISIGSQAFTYSSGPSSGAEVFANGHTTFSIVPGAIPTTVGTQVVSADFYSQIVVGSSTYKIGTASGNEAEQADTIVVETQTLTEITESSGAGIFAGQHTTFTVSPGGSAAIIDGQTVSAASSGRVVIGTSTVDIVPVQTTFTVGTQLVTASRLSNGDQALAVGSSSITLTPGGTAATIGTEVISEVSNGAVTEIPSVGSGGPDTEPSPLSSTTTTSGATTIMMSAQSLFGVIALLIMYHFT